MTTNLTDLQLLDLSIDAYNDQADPSKIPSWLSSNGYQRLDLEVSDAAKNEGFGGSVYYDEQNQKLVVSFAGTDQFIGGVSDLDDDDGFVTGADIDQFPFAIEFYDNALQKVKVGTSYVSKVFILNFLLPKILKAVLTGSQPGALKLQDIIAKQMSDLCRSKKKCWSFSWEKLFFNISPIRLLIP